MNEKPKSRVAIGVFRQPDRLREAIGMLKQVISLEGTIAVLGKPDVIGETFPDSPAIQLGGLSAYAVKRDGLAAQSPPPEHQAASFADWIDPASASNLDQHLAKDACILFTFFSGALEELNVYRILMKLACDRVELHDLKPENLD